MPIDWLKFVEDNTAVAEPPPERLDDTSDPVAESKPIDWVKFSETFNSTASTEPKAEPSRNLLEQFGTGLREVASPWVGRTPSQKQRDFQAAFAADPQAALKLTDEKGNLRETSEGYLNAVGRGIQQLGNIGVAIDLALADTLGADNWSAYFLERYKKNQAEIAASAPAVPTWESVGKGYGNDLSGLLEKGRHVATYAIERLGENVPNIGLSMIGGGVGSYLVRQGVTKGLTGAAAEAALAAAGKKIALGATIGAIPPAVAIEMGSIYGDMVEHDIRGAVPATVALLAALPAGMLEALTPALLVNRIAGKGVASPISSFLRSTMGTALMKSGVAKLGVAGLEGVITEGPVEWVQTAIEQAARISQDPKAQGKFWEEFFAGAAERKEAAIAGAFVGGLMDVGAHGLGSIGRKAEEERAAAVKAEDLREKLRVLGLHATAAAVGEKPAEAQPAAPPEAAPLKMMPDGTTFDPNLVPPVEPGAAAAPVEAPPVQPEALAPPGETVAAAKAPSVMEQQLGQAIGSRGLGDHVVVISDPSQLPPAAIEDMARRAVPVDPNSSPSLYHDGKVYFIASHSAWEKKGKIQDLIVHEVFIHKGLRIALGEENFSKLVNDIWGTLSNADRLAIRENQGLRADQTGIIGEEWLASKAVDVARRNVSDNLWARIVVALKRAARKYGLKLQWTDLEIARLIAKGSEAVGQTTTPGEGQGVTRLSVMERNNLTEVESASPEQLTELTRTTWKSSGGLTGKAYEVGRGVQSREELDELQAAMERQKTKGAQEKEQGNWTEAMSTIMKAQFFREAYEAATGTGSAGHFLTTRDPNYKPPFPIPSTTRLSVEQDPRQAMARGIHPLLHYDGTQEGWGDRPGQDNYTFRDPATKATFAVPENSTQEQVQAKFDNVTQQFSKELAHPSTTRLAVEKLTPEQTANIKSQIVGVKSHLRRIEGSFSYQRYEEQTPEVIAATALLEDRKSYLEERLAALEARIGQVSEVKSKVTKVAFRTEISKLKEKGGESNAREIKDSVEVSGGEAPGNVAQVAEGAPGGVRKPVGPQKKKVKGGENIEEKEKRLQVGQPPAPSAGPDVLTPGEEADLFNALSVMGGKAAEQQQTKAQQDAAKKAAELKAAKDLYKKNKTTRLAVEPSPIANAATDAELIALGFEPTSKGLRKPDAVLAATVQARMIRNPQWVPTLVEAQLKKPTMQTDEEVLAIDWYFFNARTAHATAAKKGLKAQEQGHPAEASAYFMEAEGWSKILRKFAGMTHASGREMGRAMRARQLALNEEFEVSNMLIAAQEKNGWIPLTEEETAEIVKQSEQLKQNLADEIALTNKQRVELADMELELARAKLGEKAQVHPDVLKFVSNWVAGLKKKRDEAKATFDADWAAVDTGDTRLATEGPAPTEPRQLPPQLMEKVTIIGAYQLAINNVSKAGWETAMVAELGERIRPYLAAARVASEAQLQAELKAASKDYGQVIKTPRKPKPTPTTPTEPRPTRPEREPSEGDVDFEELPVEERIDDVTDRLRKRIEIADRDGKEPKIFGLVQQLVRLLVEQNPTINRDQMVSIVHGILTPLIPGITEIETMDAISGRGRFTEPNQEENAKHLRELKAQIRVVAHNMDVIAIRPRPKTGMGRDPRSDEVRNLERILNESRHIYGDVVTDPEHQLRTFLDARKKWFENAITDLRFEIEHRKRILKAKMQTGTDAELEAMKVEHKQLTVERDAIFFDAKVEAAHQLELLEKAAQRQIDRLQGQIKSGNIFPPGKKPKAKKATSDKLEALNGEIAALERERDYARMALQPAPEIQDKANLARALALEKEIQAIQADIEANAPFVPKTKEPTEEADFNVERAARLQAKQAELAQLRNESGYNLERGIQLRIMQIQRGTAEYAKRISENNFLPKTKKQTADIVTDPRILKVQAEAEIIKQKYYQKLHEFEMRNKTKMERFWIGIKRTPGAIINLKSSFDFSAMRQALPAIGSLATRTLTHPIGAPLLIAKIFRKMFSATWSDQRAFAEQKRLDARFNRRSGADSKVDYTGLDSHSFTPGEENARSIFDEWAQLPFRTGSIWKSGLTALPKLGSRSIRASNRAFVTFLNVTRAALFDELVSANFKDRPPTQVELDVISNYVNIATGRGKMPPDVAHAASWVFWAPKLFTSRAQLLIGQPLWGGGARAGSGRARKIIAKEYARLLASGALLALVSGLFDDKKEEDPKSSDYGKIVRGNVRIDLWGGFQQLIVLASRFATQETKTAKGRVQKANLAEVFWRFLRTKLRPDAGVAFDFFTRQDLMGEKFSYAEAAKDLIIPLPWTDVLAILKDRGFSETVAIQMLNQFGAGVSIQDREKRRRNY